ncbi:MAG TPA: VOC family protein [Methylomirabilota bacterium]|nr:VOC family protein [Methylomirabilota bacterium]
MLRGIDHLVVVVPELERATAQYRELGFTVVPGGRHPVGTHNALIALADDAYLELIAFYEANPDHRWWTPLQQGGGLVDFCLRTDDLPADVAALRRAGVDLDDPKPLTRVRPDGYKLAWVLAIPRGRQRGVVPFLIQDETPREERIPRETRHPNGVSGIDSLVVAVDDAEMVRRWYRSALGTPGEDVRREDLGGAGVVFAIGSHRFEFVASRSARAPLADWLRARGPSPYAATLKTTSGRRGPLDEQKTLGARLSLV